MGRPRNRAQKRMSGSTSDNSRRLNFELLEDRRLLAITVDTVLDVVDVNDGVISLREAIATANTTAGAEVIDFAPALTATSAATILLTHGELAITAGVTINGPGASRLKIDASGNDPTPTTNNGDGSRVFNIDDGSAAFLEVSLVGLTVTGGDSSGNGGGVRSLENLTMTDSTINDNNSELGGVYSDGGSLRIIGSKISNNRGGGVWASSTLAISTSTISGNSSSPNAGGVYSRSSLELIASTIDSNTGSQAGGILSKGALTIVGSTLRANQSTRDGGGIRVSNATGQVARIAHSTIAFNWADATDVAGNFYGGGVFADPASLGSIELDHALVANNTRIGSTYRDDLSGAVQVRYSLIGDKALSAVTDLGGNIIGTNTSPVDAKLGGFSNNGGPTNTYQLLADSPAIDAGDMSLTAGGGGTPLTDQRGVPFDRIFDCNFDGIGRIDIGAVERQWDSFVVDTLADESDGDYSAGDLSLREATELMNASVREGRITFSEALFGGTIVLTLGELTIANDATIVGPANNLITIDASGNDPTPTVNNGDGSRVFAIISSSPNILDVVIDGLTLTGGDAAVAGGAIGTNGGVLSSGSLTVANCTISGNSALQRGGGVYVADSQTLSIRSSVITGNAAKFGGGVRGGRTYVVDSTVSANTAQTGGGIFVRGVLTMSGSTIADNIVSDVGGGIFYDEEPGVSIVFPSSIELSVISGNTARMGGGLYTGDFIPILKSTFTNNAATADGGAICFKGSASSSVDDLLINKCVISQNQALRGGGVYIELLPRVSIIRSVFDGNTATSGAGIFNASWLTVSYTVLSGNTATNGAGLYNTSLLTLSYSTLHGNTVTGKGGAIWSNSLSTTSQIANSTISGNAAGQAGGGVYNFDELTISSCTITNNVSPAATGSGVASRGVSTAHTWLHSSIVAGNVNSDVDYIGGATNTFSSSSQNNILGSGNSLTIFNASFNQKGVVTAPVGPLVYNGGPVLLDGTPMLTHAPLPGSIAINQGGGGSFSQYDQRGAPFLRNVGGRIDVGAVEVQANPLPGDYNYNHVVDAADYVLWRKTLGPTTDFRADGDGDRSVTSLDVDFWRARFGNVPAVRAAIASEAAMGAIQDAQPPLAATSPDGGAFASLVAVAFELSCSVESSRSTPTPAAPVANSNARDRALALLSESSLSNNSGWQARAEINADWGANSDLDDASQLDEAVAFSERKNAVFGGLFATAL